MKELTCEQVKQVIRYEHETGRFFWLSRTGGTAIEGREAKGTVGVRGYTHIGILGGIYKAHRLAFLFVTGEWPSGEVDHINGNKSDNRFSNLRISDRTTNQQNKRTANRNNKTGMLGVGAHKTGAWQARIWVNGKNKSLGLFKSPELAHAAYVEAKRKEHQGCTI